MNRLTVLAVSAVVLGVAIIAIMATMLFMRPTATPVVEPPAPPTMPTRPAPVKKTVVKPAVVAPTAPQPAAIINIYGCCPIPPLAPVAAPPAPQSAPAAPSAPPADDCSEAYQWQCSSTAPSPAVRSQPSQAGFVPSPTRTVNVLSGNSLSINILSSVGGGGYRSGVAVLGYGYGYGYGPRWVPGYQRWVCEGPPPPAGPGCYYKWEPAHYQY